MGRTYPPTAVYEVGREKIREFADAIGDPNPVYRDPAVAQDLGHRDVLAPPTFPIAITWPAATVRSSRTRSWAWTSAGCCTATSGSSTPGRSTPTTS